MTTPKVRTDKDLIDKFLNRGVERIFPTKEALRKKLESGERIKAYQGFDPTGPYLHVGHAMGIRGLRILQQLGHEVVFLVGDFTARVGDPDKETGRRMLTPEEIDKNAEGWKQQAANLIDFEGDNPVQFRHNYEWLSKLDLYELIQLMSKTTVQQMIERDMFERRLAENNPIGLQELLYPLMQGYDSVAMKVDLEIGGTDQIFNMLVGRTLCKSYLGKEKFVRANIMMDAPDARTMSKTKGNGINLIDSAEDMYGKGMSYPDNLIPKGLELLTEVPLKDIAEIDKEIQSGKNQMQHKKFMAFEIVKTILGEEAARRGEEYFRKTVQEKETPDDIPIIKITTEGTTIDVALGVIEAYEETKSKSEIKRIIQQGGFEIDGVKYTNPLEEVKLKSGQVIKVGKRNFGKIF